VIFKDLQKPVSQQDSHKDGIDKRLYDYEEIIFDSLVTHDGNANNKHVWIKKATGLGI
jgi:hypothetical protein